MQLLSFGVSWRSSSLPRLQSFSTCRSSRADPAVGFLPLTLTPVCGSALLPSGLKLFNLSSFQHWSIFLGVVRHHERAGTTFPFQHVGISVSHTQKFGKQNVIFSVCLLTHGSSDPLMVSPLGELDMKPRQQAVGCTPHSKCVCYCKWSVYVCKGLKRW